MADFPTDYSLGGASCIFLRRRHPPIVFSLKRGELPSVFLLAGENLSLALLGRKDHSIVFSVGGKMLTAASLHCICSRREDAHLRIVFRMREISPLHSLQDKRCFLLKFLCMGEAIAFCLPSENLPI